MNSSGNNDEKGLLWKLPVLNSRQLGKLGPGFGVGAGCGVGFGVSLIGGTGFGPGFPGLQLGFGLGAGCGVGLGFGYGVGRGIAHDEYRKYSNVGKLFNGPQYLPTQDEIGAIIDDFVVNTKKLIRATSKEVETILIEFAKFLLYKPVSTDSSIYFSSNSREMCVNEMQEFLCANICSCIYAMEFVYELHGYQYHEPLGESRSSVPLCLST